MLNIPLLVSYCSDIPKLLAVWTLNVHVHKSHHKSLPLTHVLREFTFSQTCFVHVGFEVLTAVVIKVAIFLDIVHVAGTRTNVLEERITCICREENGQSKEPVC
jgi:hypothetical protein